MTQIKMAKFCATISFSRNKSKTKQEWVEFYMALDYEDLVAEFNSYMC